MTNEKSEFVNIQLNYTYIAENYEEIYIKTYKNGDILPTMFDDVNLAYPGTPVNDITLPEVDDEVNDLIRQKKLARRQVEIKHFSRSISHEAWFEHLEKEVEEFVEKYPEYRECII